MGKLDLKGFARALGGVKRIGVDTPVLIYHLENIAPYADLTAHLLTEASAGTLQVLISVVTVAEVLAGPWRTGQGDQARRIEGALKALPGVRATEITWESAAVAAELRGHTNLPLPDSLIIASTLHGGAQLLVTNDEAWVGKPLPRHVLVLDDYVRI
jgi:predicted nucleic acid-binding protein